jgi:hypothetical protein
VFVQGAKWLRQNDTVDHICRDLHWVQDPSNHAHVDSREHLAVLDGFEELCMSCASASAGTGLPCSRRATATLALNVLLTALVL